MIEELKEKVKKIYADYGEIHAEIHSVNRISYSKDNVEAVQTAKTSSGNVRVLNRGGWGFSSFNEFDYEKSISAAMKNAALAGEKLRGEGNKVAAGKPVTDVVRTSYIQNPDNVTLEEKNKLAVRYNNLLKGNGIASTRVTYTDWKIEKYFVNSEGSSIVQEKVFTGVSFGAMAKDGMNVQQAFESVGQYGGFELVTGLENRVDAVKKRAVDLLGAGKVESGQYKVLLDTNLAGVFAHEAFGHLSESDFLYENPRMMDVMVIGKEFGPDFLNIIDDGSIEGLAGFTPYDDEGIKGGKTYLIKNGKLNSRLHSRETSSKMGENPTGNARSVSPLFQPIVRMTNTFIDSGNKSFNSMIESIEDGIYAIDYLGGMTNLEMFTFSAGYAYRIKNGKISGLLRDVILTGNVFSTLHNVLAVGDDLTHHGGLGGCGKSGQGGLPVSTGSPHIIVDKVLIGGI